MSGVVLVCKERTFTHGHKALLIQESRPFVCRVYLSVSGDQRKEMVSRGQRAPDVFSGEVDCICARRKQGQLWMDEKNIARSTWWW